MFGTYFEKTRYNTLSSYQSKMSKRAVSRKLVVPYTTICNIITKWLNYGRIYCIKTNGKKIKVDNKLASIILKHNDLNSKLSSRKVAERIKVISNIDISH